MTGDVEIEVCRTEDLAETDKALITKWSEDLFGEAELEHEWSDPDWCVLVRYEGQPVTHVAKSVLAIENCKASCAISTPRSAQWSAACLAISRT